MAAKPHAYHRYYVTGKTKRGATVYYTTCKIRGQGNKDWLRDNGLAWVVISKASALQHIKSIQESAREEGVTNLRLMKDTLTTTTKTVIVRSLG